MFAGIAGHAIQRQISALWRGGRRWLVAAVLAAGACAVAEPVAPPTVVRAASTPNPAFTGGVVATSEPEATAAAAGILAAGGNAIDAAVVALLALAVVEPQSSGIGGGGFMMIHLAGGGETIVIDFRETAPAAASPTMFGDANFAVASTSGIAVGVPGAIAGLATALQRWGTISLAAALQPAIALAADGFVVGPRLADSLEAGLRPGGRLAQEPGNPAYDEARRVFAPQGRPLAAGARLSQPQLAATLAAIAARGPGAFYDCADEAGVARALVAAQRAHRGGAVALAGRLTCADLAATAAAGPTLRLPLSGRYRGVVVRTMPPPSSGGLCLIQMLAMVERFPLADVAAGFGFGAPSTLNVMQDAMRLCFADRARWMGDTDGRTDLPVAGLIDPAYVARRAANCPDPDPADDAFCLAPGQRLATVRAGDPRPEDRRRQLAALDSDGDGGSETTHVSIVDRWGNIVTTTATIESLWGSGLMVPGHGFLLNNQLTDFNLRPTANAALGGADADTFDPGANDVGPGRRPRSSMAPTILFVRDAAGRERPVAAYGSPGGATIINTVFAVTLNLIDHGMTLQAAIDAPRLALTSAAADATTAIEAGFTAATLDRLTALGYRFAAPAPIGAVQAVTVDPVTGWQAGGADRRRRGSVIGLAPVAAP